MTMAVKRTEITEKEIIEIEKCIKDKWYFITNYCYTYNKDNQKYELVPKFDYLKELLEFWDNNNHTIVVKARQLLVSNLRMMYELWTLVFGKRGTRHRICTRLAEDSYSANKPDSLFFRLRTAYDMLPFFLRCNIMIQSHPPIARNKNRDITIIGGATTENAGRGGVYDEVFIDEAAFLPYLESNIATFIPNSKKLHIVSTPNGKNYFYILKKLSKEGKTNFKIKEIKYNIRADYTEEWFKKTTQNMTDVQIAREYLCSFDESVQARVFRFDYSHIITHNFNKDEILKSKIYGGMDFGLADDTALILAYEKDGKLIMFINISGNNMLPKAFFQHVLNKLKMQGFTEIEALNILEKAKIFCDLMGDNRSLTHDTTLASEYKKLGMINLQTIYRHEIKLRIKEIQEILSKGNLTEIINGDFDSSVAKHIQQCHYAMNRSGVITDFDRYAHDSESFSSHIIDALGYMILGFKTSPTLDKKPINVYYLNTSIFEAIRKEIEQENEIIDLT